MATRKSITQPAPDRATVAFRAAGQLSELSDALLEQIEGLETSETGVVRALALRMRALADAAVWALADDTVPLRELDVVVSRGVAPA